MASQPTFWWIVALLVVFIVGAILVFLVTLPKIPKISAPATTDIEDTDDTPAPTKKRPSKNQPFFPTKTAYPGPFPTPMTPRPSEPAVKVPDDAGWTSMGAMLMAKFGSQIYLPPDNPKFVSLNNITPLPDSLDQFIQRKNLIETPNLDVIYAPAVIDLRNQAVQLTLPAQSRMKDRYYIAQFVSITGEDVVVSKTAPAISSKSNQDLTRFWILYSGKYAPKSIKPMHGHQFIRSPSSVLYMMIRVQCNLQDENDYDDALRFLRSFSLSPHRFSGLPKPTSTTLQEFRKTFPDISGLDVRSPTVDMAEYFTAFAALMPLQLENQPDFWSKFPQYGIQPGKADPTPSELAGLGMTVLHVQQKEEEINIKGPSGVELTGVKKNGWISSQVFYLETYGLKQFQYLQNVGRGWKYIFANQPREAIYFSISLDSTGKPLNGSQKQSYLLSVPTLPKLADQSNGFWSVCAYNLAGFNTVAKHFTVGAGVEKPTTILMSGSIPSATLIDNSLLLLVPAEPFYVVFRVYAPDDSILLDTSLKNLLQPNKNAFFPQPITLI